MPIIQSHDITLYGGNDIDIILRPLCDAHLPLLYQWNADPEVTYFTESAVDLRCDKKTVRRKYGGALESILYFLIEADGIPIGECWLQKMNLPDVIAMYPKALDVRRIDMAIGEKAYWNRGIGTQFIGMLIDFAFCGEHVDVLHCFCEDYNVRSRGMWEKHGFTRVKEEPETYNPKWRSPIGKWQYHYRLTRQDFIQRRRERIPAEKQFLFPIADLQPSQLYISEGKLRLVREWFNPANTDGFDPIPVKRFDGCHLMTDGHTRAVAAHLAGWDSVPVYWDEDDLDMRAYAMDIKWCHEEGIHSPVDLACRIVPHKEYERLWRKRCMEMVLE